MVLLIIFWVVVLACIVAAVKKKRALFLTLPIALMGVYVFVEIARLPMPIWDAIQLILNLR
ncbi:hypothetical protein [Alteribacillus iranensis]|uniref:Uncharacterized protein n=1 Tax=Alteribacillus iranensis TaxID=930128 RepID=A0A1I2BYT9_9BACI|nr:hypothetical protein [Alteribacillus iranensis]SFE61058.1 hypothetical protein SAMN05192532_102577 [Alteribacillus iranensis]